MIAALVRVGKDYLPWRALAILSSNFAKGGAMRRRPEIENLRKLGVSCPAAWPHLERWFFCIWNLALVSIEDGVGAEVGGRDGIGVGE